MSHGRKPDSSIEILPKELIVAALNELDVGTLLRSRQLCRSVKNLVDHTPRLQYKIELAIAGMEDNPCSKFGIEEHRARLETYQAGWADLCWQKEEVLVSSGGEPWDLFGNVMVAETSTGGLSFKKLEGCSRGVEGREWELDLVDIEIDAFALDPPQDLLVLVETYGQRLDNKTSDDIAAFLLQFRSMTTGDSHPFTGYHIAHITGIPFHAAPTDMGFDIKVAGDYVGVLFKLDEFGAREICVWNWKTSCLLKCFKPYPENSISHTTAVFYSSFAFLTESQILISVTYPVAKLEVYNFAEGPTTTWREGPFSVRLELLYPAIPISWYTGLAIVVDPPLSSRARHVDVPFHFSPDSRIVAITVAVSNDADTGGVWHHFIPITVFTSALSQSPDSHLTTPGCFEWEKWAPDQTCLVSDCRFPSWHCVISGTRCPPPFEANVDFFAPDELEVEVLDFNPVALRRDPRGGEVSEFRSVHLEVGDARCTFPSKMPYRRKVVTLPPHLHGALHHVLISEDCVILVYTLENGDFTYNVLTF
ncbi:hypothetical protein JAAARDRAFT_195327 [Jaapia argillacea MUCL 33604]|uniref:F-box domain-containing protein n=1 Tax=Jaapia argillacea MUCL 33604 TaxID=933084 RepID=A0A067PQM9_9AGAM|nr:hypothetical protein JAAARDRAFT_195327 [Jaapia argillacea MUCL 33604]